MRISAPFRMVAIVILLMLTLAACGRGSDPTATPTATPVPPTAAPIVEAEAATVTPVLVEAPITDGASAVLIDDPWARIQAAGKMVVGTSADYPPFESYDDDFQIVGFDPALIKAIAINMGVEVELKDFAFDGLASALQLGQIDAAMAAISVTEEREQQVDFSNIYYVSQDAVLAGTNTSLLPINSLRDLANLRIGVQSGSVYEDVLNDNLVETGLVPATNIYSYGDIGRAVQDASDGLIDVVMLDLLVAESFVEEADVKIVAQGLNYETYAIAFVKGATELQTNVNEVLNLLQETGVTAKLIGEYLDVKPEHIVPVPSPTPTPAQPVVRPPSTACIDSMTWVSDLSYDDQNMTAPPLVPAGQPFRKGWRVLNSGTCTWDSSYFAGFVQGNIPGAQMGGRSTAIDGTVAPGATYDLYVDLIAPLQPAVYQGVWQLHNGQGVGFGEKLWVAITVPAGPVATVIPTQTPSPGISFTVDRTNITSGQCVNFSWNVTNVSAVYFYSEGENWQNNGVAGQASRQECPPQDTTYYLRVVENAGSVQQPQIRIYVEQTADAPRINRFSVDPSGQVPEGQCVTLVWEVSGDVTQVDLFRNDDRFWRDAPFRGSTQDCPPGPGSYAYRIKAQGPGGNNEAVDHVDVIASQPTTQPPTATPIPPAGPTINGFTVSPGRIVAGQCVSIAWSTSGADHTRISRNGSIILDQGPVSSSGVQDCPTDVGQQNYVLDAVDYTGQSNSVSVPVLVEAGAQPTATPAPVEPTATPAPAAPVISNFTASPTEISVGQCVDLTWAFSGDSLALAQITRNGQVLLADVPLSGSQQDCPTPAGPFEYVLKVDSEFGGSAQAVQNVNVLAVEAAQLPAESAAEEDAYSGTESTGTD